MKEMRANFLNLKSKFVFLDSDCSMLKVQIIGEDRAVWLYKGDPAFGTVDRQIRKSCKWWSHNGLDESILNQCDQVNLDRFG